MEKIGVMLMLAVTSIEDLISKRVNISSLALFALAGVIIRLCILKDSYLSILAGTAIGVVLLIVSKLSKGQLGMGDGAVLIVTGIYLGFWSNTALLWLASLLSGVVCLVLWLFLHKDKTYTVPFVPFLLVAYMIICFAGG